MRVKVKEKGEKGEEYLTIDLIMIRSDHDQIASLYNPKQSPKVMVKKNETTSWHLQVFRISEKDYPTLDFWKKACRTKGITYSAAFIQAIEQQLGEEFRAWKAKQARHSQHYDHGGSRFHNEFSFSRKEDPRAIEDNSIEERDISWLIRSRGISREEARRHLRHVKKFASKRETKLRSSLR